MSATCCFAAAGWPAVAEIVAAVAAVAGQQPTRPHLRTHLPTLPLPPLLPPACLLLARLHVQVAVPAVVARKRMDQRWAHFVSAPWLFPETRFTGPKDIDMVESMVTASEAEPGDDGELMVRVRKCGRVGR